MARPCPFMLQPTLVHRHFELPTLFLAVLLFFLGGFSFLCSQAKADVFVLSNGGRLEGELLNPDQEPRRHYVIRSTFGGKVALAKNQVKQVIGKSQAELLYEKFLPGMPKTGDGNWKMAQWCLSQNLEDRRRFHLKKVIEFEPDHEQARLALGFERLNGKWVNMDEYMRRQGLVRHQGAWWYPEDIEVQKKAEEATQRQKAWRRKIAMWKGWLRTNRHAEAMLNLKAIRDAEAAPELAEILLNEKQKDVKLLFIDILGQLQHPEATKALIHLSLHDDDESVRDACLEHLVKFGTRQAVAAYAAVLSNVSAKSVQDEVEKLTIHRAAIGLARMKDDSVVPLLIQAVTTKYKYKVGGPGIAATSQGGFSAGRPKAVVREEPNEAVHTALRALTGQNFGVNRDAWRAWYAKENTPKDVDLRRDP